MDWKQFGKKMLFPPIWIIVLLVAGSTAALWIVFMKGWEMLPAASIVYVGAFYSLTIFCLACWKTLPGYYRKIKESLHQNHYTNQYLTNALFKTHVTLYISFGMNLIYVLVNGVSAVVYHTYWFGIFAVYYGIMAMMRFLLARYVGRNTIGESQLGEWMRARFCTYILLTINLILSGVVLMMVYHNRGFEYQGILIYAMALYTFYSTIIAIVDLVKYRKYHSPIMSVSKIIKLTSALFSMLFLETAMFAQFGGDTSMETKRIMIMATGGGISVIVAAMAGYMIVRSNQAIKRLKYQKHKI